jgi:NAD+ diphosphatase
MACPKCELHVYPRISPAIITLVRKGDLALLASNAKFPGVFYSTLAGFADIGESLEETLVREVKEEAGVTVGNVKYFGSQPWPFPNSLMIGFTAEWLSGEIQIDPNEISDAQWFAADKLPVVPPPLSIARRLIDAWVEEVTGRRP